MTIQLTNVTCSCTVCIGAVVVKCVHMSRYGFISRHKKCCYVGGMSFWFIQVIMLTCVATLSVALNITDGTTIGYTTTWTLTDSPVFVSGTLGITSGGSLVVDAGVNVVFETPGSGITVKSGGQLLITGMNSMFVCCFAVKCCFVLDYLRIGCVFDDGCCISSVTN